MRKLVNKTVHMWLSSFTAYPMGALDEFRKTARHQNWTDEEITKVVFQVSNTKGGKEILDVLRMYCKE